MSRQTPEAKEYSYKDLHVGTGGFSPSNRLGRDHSSVYHGLLNGAAVAIKDVKEQVDLREEVRLLGRLCHPNLVCLLGWSMHQPKKCLVYELLSGGDLHSHLESSRSGEATFQASRRRAAALDAAKGLCYMVNLVPKAFHRDIKPLNIVLDTKGVAKMVDFGFQDKANLKVDRISGTPGYACPIYLQTGKVNEQSEVFSFGTVLLELLVNEAPALTDGKGGFIYPLLQMIQPAAAGALLRVLKHAELSAEWKPTELEELAQLALRCVAFEPQRRPLFKDIVEALRPRTRELRTPRYSEVQGPAPNLAALDELILCCVWTPVFSAPSAHNITLKAEPKDWEVAVGRNHQPDFFEKVINQESMTKISRSHFKIGVSQNQLLVSKQSSNPFRVNGVPLEQGSSVAIRNNDMLTLSEPPIVVLRVQLRFLEAPRKSLAWDQRSGATAVLECVKSVCTNVKDLPKEAKRIALNTGHIVEVGRKHQELIFDKLLKAHWLYNISRTHLKVCFHATEFLLQVQNLSTNPVMVNGRQLKQSQTGTVWPGGCIAFLARSDGKEQTFLEFNLHTAGQ